jgi:hypothetical protein
MNKLNSTKVLLNSVVRIKFFNELALKYPGHTLDLVSGRYRVPASSLMGIFSLDVSKPLTLEYEDEYEDFVKDKFTQFEVK